MPETIIALVFESDQSIHVSQEGGLFTHEGKNSPYVSYVHAAEALQPSVLGQRMSERGRALKPRRTGEGKTPHFKKVSINLESQ